MKSRKLRKRRKKTVLLLSEVEIIFLLHTKTCKSFVHEIGHAKFDETLKFTKVSHCL